jgi:hypothetical protein
MPIPLIADIAVAWPLYVNVELRAITNSCRKRVRVFVIGLDPVRVGLVRRATFVLLVFVLVIIVIVGISRLCRVACDSENLVVRRAHFCSKRL